MTEILIPERLYRSMHGLYGGRVKLDPPER